MFGRWRNDTRRIAELAVLAALLIAVLGGGLALANSERDQAKARINVRPLADGRIEFALQVQGARCIDDHEADLMERETVCEQFVPAWNERQLPVARLLPNEPRIGGWYSSTPILIGDVETRIRVRRLANGRTEFVLQQRGIGEPSWGDHIEPSRRFMSAAHRVSHVDRWLNSTTVQVSSAIIARPGAATLGEG